MEKLSIIQKVLLSSFPIFGIIFLILSFLNIDTYWIETSLPYKLLIGIFVQLGFILSFVFLYKRIFRITNNKDFRNTQILLMVLFYPYILYYVWKKDDEILKANTQDTIDA